MNPIPKSIGSDRPNESDEVSNIGNTHESAGQILTNFR